MFNLQPNPTFLAQVAISIPGAAAVEVEFEFRHKTRDGLKRYFDGAKDRTDDDLVGEIVAGWRGVDADFSASNLKALLANYPAAASEIVSSYAQALTTARLGN